MLAFWTVPGLQRSTLGSRFRASEGKLVPGPRGARTRGCCAAPGTQAYSMCQPWVRSTDWPVSALVGNAANTKAISATSSSVVNSLSTV